MSLADGFLGIIIFIDLIFCILGTGVLTLTYLILELTNDRRVHAAISVLVMAAGFVLFSAMDAPMLLSGSAACGIPGAVLFMGFVVSHPAGKAPVYSRVLACSLVVSAIGFLLPFLLVWSGLSMAPVIFWHTPFSNGAIYAGAMVLYLLLAGLVFRLIDMREKARAPGPL
jgi:hypothetical protein